MSNLSSFAELIKQGKEEKRLREEQELLKKQKEVVPLLSELFQTVAKAKQIKEIETQKVKPLLTELETALKHPEKAKQVKEQKKQKIVDLVQELETNLAKAVTVDTVNELVEKTEATMEQKLVSMVKKPQDDIANLKRHVDSKPTSTNVMGGTAGSGEVRVLRMDDVDKTNLQDGAVMTYNATLNKLVFTMPTGGSGTTTDEEMPFAKRIDFITDNEFYRGEAVVGASESSPVWRIRKVTLGADSDVTEVWANGNSNYTNRWSDRLTLNYT